MNKLLNPRNPRRPSSEYEVYKLGGNWYCHNTQSPVSFGFTVWNTIEPEYKVLLEALSIGEYTAFALIGDDRYTGFIRVACPS